MEERPSPSERAGKVIEASSETADAMPDDVAAGHPEHLAVRAHRADLLTLLAPELKHELNNSVGAIAAFAELLRTDARVPDDLRGDVAFLAEEAARTRTLTDRVLLLVGDEATAPGPTRLPDVVAAAVDLVAAPLGASGVPVELDLPVDLPPLAAGPRNLLQLLLGVLARVIQTTRAGGPRGTLRIRALPVPATSGERPAVELRIDHPALAVPPPGNEHSRSLNEALLGAAGGRLLDAAPRESGFRASLPTSAPAGGMVPATSHPRPGTAAGLRGVILVVDDQPAIRLLLQGTLSRSGHEVTTAEGGAEALSVLDRLAFDILFLDHRMPGMDGVETYRAVAELRPELAGRTVMMSGDVLDPALRELNGAGGVRLLAKPFELEAVESVVQQILAQPERGRRTPQRG